MQSMEAAVRRCLDQEARQVLETRIAETRLRSWDDVGRDVMAVLGSV